MALQAKMKTPHDPRLYNPNRDLAHNFDFVIQEVAKRAEAQSWKALNEVLKEHEVTLDQMGAGCQSLCNYVMGTLDEPKETMAESMTRSGWFEQPAAVQVALMAYLGTVTLGVHWTGVREATLGGEGPMMSYRDLREFGAQQVKYMNMGRWRARWERIKVRVRRAIEAFRKEL